MDATEESADMIVDLVLEKRGLDGAESSGAVPAMKSRAGSIPAAFVRFGMGHRTALA